MNIFKKVSEIEKLKRKAADAIIKHRHLTDHLSCGANLAAHISPSVAAAAMEFNSTMARLKKLDPACPDYSPLNEGN